MEGSDNGYSTCLENRRPQGLVGSNPTPSAILRQSFGVASILRQSEF